jgi:DNA-binding LacI/PurR family transcriptional regulator
MARSKSEKNGNNEPRNAPPKDRPISLKQLAEYVGLSPAALSLVLNDSPAASAIPQETKDRIFEAARKFNYRPNYIARSLRAQRTYTLGVLVPELSGGYAAEVLAGIEEYLLEQGYVYFVACHHHRRELIKRYPHLLFERCVEGLIAVDTPDLERMLSPVVCVSGHDQVDGITNIVLDHDHAATLALEHLAALGHRRIAVIKGQVFSSDTEVRWGAIQKTAERLKIPIRTELIAQLEGDSPSPRTGYLAARQLIEQKRIFSALFSFNDVSAIGAISALREAGYRVPEDVSVIGFDDIPAAAFHNPALTTIKQPLHEMGKLAAEHVLRRISHGPDAAFPREVVVKPELIVRHSTGARG